MVLPVMMGDDDGVITRRVAILGDRCRVVMALGDTRREDMRLGDDSFGLGGADIVWLTITGDIAAFC